MDPAHLVSLVAGLALLLFALADFLFTTIGANTYRFGTFRVARVVFAAHRLLPPGAARHHATGPMVMSAVAICWIVTIALGWALIFQAFSPGVLTSDSHEPVGFTGNLSHVGHLLSTLGGGITTPANMPLALLGVIAAVNGMLVLTLAVSFVLSTTQTVTAGRSMLMLSRTFRPGDPEFRSTVVPEVAALISKLNSAPFALFYSHPDPSLRLPRQLIDMLDKLDETTHGDLMRLLGELTDFRGREVTADRLEAWARQYELSPDR